MVMPVTLSQIILQDTDLERDHGLARSALQDCNCSLDIQPTYVKALFRRHTAKLILGDRAGALAGICSLCLLDREP